VGGTHPQAPAALLRALGHVPGGASAGQLGRGGQATLDGGVRAMASCVGRGGGGQRVAGPPSARLEELGHMGERGGAGEGAWAGREGTCRFPFLFHSLSFYSFYLDIVAYLYTYECTCSF
jgi:hypothetical protein